MPVITITLNRQLMSWKRVINRIWRYRVLRDRRQSCIHQGIIQRKLHFTDALLGLLRQDRRASPGTSAEPAHQRRLYIADLAADFAFHFYLVFVQGVRFAYLCFCFFYCRTFSRAAGSFVVWESKKLLAAIRAYLFDSRLASCRHSVRFIGTSTRAILASEIRSLVFEFFTATGAYADWVSLFSVTSVAVGRTLQAAIFFGLTWSRRKWLLAGQADAYLRLFLADMLAFIRAILLTFEGRLVFDTASRAYVHIAIVSQMRYCCNYE